MRPSLLAELSDLFMREAGRALKRDNFDEADRLWDIADEIHERKVRTELAEAERPIR